MVDISADIFKNERSVSMKVTIYVPEDVEKVMKGMKEPFNVSEICQQAILDEARKRTQLLLISQNARLSHMEIPHYAVLRLNVAWVRSREELFHTLDGISHDVFLDFPEGRKKPPRPILNLNDLIEAMNLYKCVRYFGATNVQSARTVDHLLKVLPSRVQLVPKIESQAGVDRLEKISAALPYATKYIMLDKEDLYTDLKSKNPLFIEYLAIVREKAWKLSLHVLELAGVIFLSDIKMPSNFPEGKKESENI